MGLNLEKPNKKDSTMAEQANNGNLLIFTYKTLDTCKAEKFLIKHGSIWFMYFLHWWYLKYITWGKKFAWEEICSGHRFANWDFINSKSHEIHFCDSKLKGNRNFAEFTYVIQGWRVYLAKLIFLFFLVMFAEMYVKTCRTSSYIVRNLEKKGRLIGWL